MAVPPRELVGVCLNIMAEIRKTIERYEKKLDRVYQNAGGAGKGVKRRRKMSNAERKDPDRIKKPRSTYIRFVMEARPLIQVMFVCVVCLSCHVMMKGKRCAVICRSLVGWQSQIATLRIVSKMKTYLIDLTLRTHFHSLYSKNFQVSHRQN